MKLKEKWAHEELKIMGWVNHDETNIEECTHENARCFLEAYRAGFKKATEMALATVRGLNPWKENPEELLKNLGEEEV
jgi:hypothetical protein